jgi:hypothetical protein
MGRQELASDTVLCSHCLPPEVAIQLADLQPEQTHGYRHAILPKLEQPLKYLILDGSQRRGSPFPTVDWDGESFFASMRAPLWLVHRFTWDACTLYDLAKAFNGTSFAFLATQSSTMASLAATECRFFSADIGKL